MVNKTIESLIQRAIPSWGGKGNANKMSILRPLKKGFDVLNLNTITTTQDKILSGWMSLAKTNEEFLSLVATYTLPTQNIVDSLEEGRELIEQLITKQSLTNASHKNN